MVAALSFALVPSSSSIFSSVLSPEQFRSALHEPSVLGLTAVALHCLRVLTSNILAGVTALRGAWETYWSLVSIQCGQLLATRHGERHHVCRACDASW